jgi:Uma2 family endonuclease
VEPDILDISKERRTVLTARNVRGARDLVVEVGSPSTRRRDARTKLKLSARA